MQQRSFSQNARAFVKQNGSFVMFLLMIFAPGLITYCVWTCVIGLMFGCINSNWYDMIGKKVERRAAAALGGSLYVVIAGVAQFIGPFWMDFAAINIFQQQPLDMVTFASGNPFYQYYPALVILAVGAIILFIFAIKNHGIPDYEKKNMEEADAA